MNVKSKGMDEVPSQSNLFEVHGDSSTLKQFIWMHIQTCNFSKSRRYM